MICFLTRSSRRKVTVRAHRADRNQVTEPIFIVFIVTETARGIWTSLKGDAVCRFSTAGECVVRCMQCKVIGMSAPYYNACLAGSIVFVGMRIAQATLSKCFRTSISTCAYHVTGCETHSRVSLEKLIKSSWPDEISEAAGLWICQGIPFLFLDKFNWYVLCTAYNVHTFSRVSDAYSNW